MVRTLLCRRGFNLMLLRPETVLLILEIVLCFCSFYYRVHNEAIPRDQNYLLFRRMVVDKPLENIECLSILANQMFQGRKKERFRGTHEKLVTDRSIPEIGQGLGCSMRIPCPYRVPITEKLCLFIPLYLRLTFYRHPMIRSWRENSEVYMHRWYSRLIGVIMFFVYSYCSCTCKHARRGVRASLCVCKQADK